MLEAARVIRRHLDAEAGRSEARVHHLLSTFDVEDDVAGRRFIADELLGAGVRTDRPLADLLRDDIVLLSVVDRSAAEMPAPWAQAPGAEAPGASADQRRSARRRIAIVALALVLASTAGFGSYVLGSSSGEDLDAARAAGERQGQREGAARGTAQGYKTGVARGKTAGYRQTYDKAYARAYKQQFRRAGLPIPAKVKFRDAAHGRSSRGCRFGAARGGMLDGGSSGSA